MGWEGSPVCSVLPVVIQTHCTQEDPNSKHENICFILSANLLLILPPALSLSLIKQSNLIHSQSCYQVTFMFLKGSTLSIKLELTEKKKNRENTQKMLVRNT